MWCNCWLRREMEQSQRILATARLFSSTPNSAPDVKHWFPIGTHSPETSSKSRWVFALIEKLWLTFVFLLQVGAIDALEHSGLNTDFGIIGLPSIIIFHQGRMIQKFNTTQQASVTNLVNFIQAHTNLISGKSIVVTSEDFSPTSPLRISMQEETFDIYLALSWSFIILCAIYYFSKSTIFRQITEMINRTWRESNEAQLQ